MINGLQGSEGVGGCGGCGPWRSLLGLVLILQFLALRGHYVAAQRAQGQVSNN